MWLLTPSLNVITVNWDSTDTTTSATLTINQSNFTASLPLLRYHKVNIAYFYSDATYTTAEQLISNTAQTTATYDGSKGVVAILVNAGH
jgi:hypothetical protein